MSVKKVDAYECPACGLLYENRRHATECCAGTSIEVWKCEKCGDLYRRKEIAEQCCEGGG